jgi:hypothetical protein
MYTFNMLDHAEMYQKERLREAAHARMRAEILVPAPSNIVVMLGETLTGLGAVLTALGTYLAGHRSA